MSKVVYLPLDERPCNAKYPVQLASIADMPLVFPSADMLGKKKQPARHEDIAAWLVKETKDASHLIVSVDMLVYGGIVPSRLHHLSESECLRRLSLLSELKRSNPSLEIHAFNLIMRAPAYNSSDEEPDYYEHYGYRLYRYGWLKDKAQYEKLDDEEQQERDRIAAEVPQEVLNDFLHRRQVNAAVNLQAISLVDEGIIDHLIIPLDDNAKYGFSPMEQRKLLTTVEQLNLLDRVLIYPGADEIGCTLLARVFCRLHGYRPEVFVRYSSTLGPTIVPKYEDRSLNESIKSHLTSAGAVMADSPSGADVVLMVHSPPVSQADVAESPYAYSGRHRAYFSEVHIPEFAVAIESQLDKGRLVALADVASSNGSDHALMKLLSKKKLLGRLTAYAGWNTSGNTLGTVIAHAVIASYWHGPAGSVPDRVKRASRAFLLSRYVEDWGYQTLVRKDVAENHLPAMGGDYFRVGHIREQVSALITEKLQRFCRQYLSDVAEEADIARLRTDQPWNRMFETDVTFE